MAEFVKGEVVVVPFPYSDLSQSKRRPAAVVTVLSGGDLILCQITSQATSVLTNCSLPKASSEPKRCTTVAWKYQ